MSQYHHPLDEGKLGALNSPSGVMELVEKSHLMELIRELEKDGHDVSGAAAELVALVNYVTSTQLSLSDIQTHLDYCVLNLKKSIR
ncbi:hypothetical protein [Cronobacter sakazakii]|uniref:hypothetical protein n=1 Tax=Cronobacter sakazakii TaxID=28141 RepID=UPI000DA1D510|nr:hypothetical protein [Cronobacter sakazakii]MCI0304929.1 hypothetical protein [Cronobacter sakazakii]